MAALLMGVCSVRMEVGYDLDVRHPSWSFSLVGTVPSMPPGSSLTGLHRLVGDKRDRSA